MLPNFIVDAPTRELSVEVMRRAENHRRHIAQRWTGGELPTWSIPCLVFVVVGDKPYGHVYYENTAFVIRGQYDEMMSCVLPHEVAHMVIRSYYGPNFALWADEAIAISSECGCSNRFLGHYGTQPLHELFNIRDYPNDWKSFYGQSYSVMKYITGKYCRESFLNFVQYGSGPEGKTEWDESAFLYLGTSLDRLYDDWRHWHSKTFEPIKRDAGLFMRSDGPSARWWSRMAKAFNPRIE